MIAVALAALWLGGIAFWLLASAAALLMLAEWAGLMRRDAGCAIGSRCWRSSCRVAGRAAPFG